MSVSVEEEESLPLLAEKYRLEAKQGDVIFESGDLDKAEDIYEKCLSRFEENPVYLDIFLIINIETEVGK